jgi:hypothetical protein
MTRSPRPGTRAFRHQPQPDGSVSLHSRKTTAGPPAQPDLTTQILGCLAAAVYPELVVQVRPVAGPVAGHPGDADLPGSPAAHLHHRTGAARCPGAALRRASAPALPRPRSRSRRPGRARWFYLRPHLVLPHRHRVLVALERLPDRDMDRPAVPAQQLRDALEVYPTWNSLPISVLIRPSVHRWPAGRCAARPPAAPTAAGSAARATPVPWTQAPRRRPAAGPAATSAPSVPSPASPRPPARCYPRAQTGRPPPAAPARAAAAQRTCTRHVAHTACHRHTTAAARRHYIE